MQRLIGRLFLSAMLAGLPLAAASAQVMNQDDCKRPGGCPPGSSRPGGVEHAPSAPPMGQTRGIAPRPAAPATKPAQAPEAMPDAKKQTGAGQSTK